MGQIGPRQLQSRAQIRLIELRSTPLLGYICTQRVILTAL